MTTKAIGELVTAEVMIDSATKKKRSTQNGEVTEWALRVFVPTLGIKDYSTPTSMAVEWATDLMAGEQHWAQLRRGRLKDGKDAGYNSNYWWDVAAWDVDEPSALSYQPSASPLAAHGSQDEYLRSKA